MTRFLCIFLAGPLASFSESPGSSERLTFDRPTRSALLGLAGAALGIRRDQADRQKALSESFAIATRTLNRGRLLNDYHTYEGVQRRSKTVYRTRAQALASGEGNTQITRREYRSGGAWQAAYMEKPGAAIPLETLEAAFRTPFFTLWLGRKSCPLSHPLDPCIIEGASLGDVFAKAHQQARLPLPGKPSGGVIACEAAALLEPGNAIVRRNVRHDDPINRAAWTFRAREEFEFMTGMM